MTKRDPVVADSAPSADTLTPYDKEHLVTYLRLLDANTQGADWTEAARIVLGMDPEQAPQRARAVWESHLERAKWMTTTATRISFVAAIRGLAVSLDFHATEFTSRCVGC